MTDPAQAQDAGGARAGLFASLQRVLATLVSLAHTRLDLASTEIEEQAERLVSLLMWGVAAVFVGAAALLLCALALAAAAATIWGFVSRVRARPRFLEATLAELAKDRERLSRR